MEKGLTYQFETTSFVIDDKNLDNL